MASILLLRIKNVSAANFLRLGYGYECPEVCYSK